MTRRRRLAIVAAAVLASFAGTGVAANALTATPSLAQSNSGENVHGDWLCVHIDTAELTFCQGDPLPDRLIPDTPSL